MDFSWLGPFFNGITAFMLAIWTFFTSGIYDFFVAALVIATKASIYSYLQFTLFSLDIAYTVVQEILQESGVTALVKSSWASIPGDIQSTLAFFNVPQGLTLIFSAIPTKWAMKFIPFIGK